MKTTRRPGGSARRFFGLWLVLVAAATAVAVAQPPEANDDDFRRHALQRSVRENCLICHSDELITSSRLTPKQWQTEVEKMVGWGAPVPKDEQKPMIDYLSAEYPAEAPPGPGARMTYAQAAGLVAIDPPGDAPRGDAARGAPAYVKNCANCHGADGQGAELGPNLVEKLVLWRQSDYLEIVRRGRGRMPGFAALLNERVEGDVLAWLRSRRYKSPVTASQ